MHIGDVSFCAHCAAKSRTFLLKTLRTFFIRKVRDFAASAQFEPPEIAFLPLDHKKKYLLSNAQTTTPDECQ